METDNRPVTVLRENKKYKILMLSSLPGKAHNFDVSLGCCRIQLQVTGSILKLQCRHWSFGWSWRTIGVTNQYSIGEHWIETYFKGGI